MCAPVPVAGSPARASRRRRIGRSLGCTLVAALVFAPGAATAQSFEQRGFLDATFTGYPLTHWNDSTKAVAEGLLRWDPSIRAGSWRFDASLDARIDSDNMTQHSAEVTYWDRTIKRPLFAVRQASASWARGVANLTIGKQFIRWGKTDIVIPTDRFSPRDYLNVINTEVLGVTAARLVLSGANDSLDLVYSPQLTPSRMPLFDQRWVVLPPVARGLPVIDDGAEYPGRPQFGVRWNHVGRYFEHSLSVFRGTNSLPLIDIDFRPAPPHIHVLREYPQLTVAGGDIAVPTPIVTIKAEAAWLGSKTARADELVLYVIQLERQVGEWLFVAGYAGEHVIKAHLIYRFTPDRGLSRSIVGRAGFTIDTNRSLAVEAVARQNGDGFYNKFEYTQALNANWRLTGIVAIFKGSPEDFLGQFEQNSFGALTVRYSF